MMNLILNMGKERITILLDQQVVNAFREMATADKGYQTLIREALRDYIFGLAENDIVSRLDRLEQVVLKKPDKSYYRRQIILNSCAIEKDFVE